MTADELVDSLNDLLDNLEELVVAIGKQALARPLSPEEAEFNASVNRLDSAIGELAYGINEKAGRNKKSIKQSLREPGNAILEQDITVYGKRTPEEVGMALSFGNQNALFDDIFDDQASEAIQSADQVSSKQSTKTPIKGQGLKIFSSGKESNQSSGSKKGIDVQNQDDQIDLFSVVSELPISKAGPESLELFRGPPEPVPVSSQNGAAPTDIGADLRLKKQELLIGIDLGTDRTSVMSSRGERFSFASVVGYPADMLGRKLLGAGYLVGDGVLNKPYLRKNYPLKEGVIRRVSGFDYEAARKLIEHALKLVSATENDRLCAVIGIPANTAEVNRQLLLDLARIYIDVVMIVSEPFMVAYGAEQLTNAIIADIGAGTTDLCGMKGRLPQVRDQVSITKAGDYVDELLQSSIEASFPGIEISRTQAKRFKEKYAFVGSAKRKVEVSLRRRGNPFVADIGDEIRYACESIVPDLIEQIKAMIFSFDINDQAKAMNNIILSGGGSRIDGLGVIIANSLREYGDVSVSRIEDIEFSGAIGALMLACELPPEYWDQFECSFDYED